MATVAEKIADRFIHGQNFYDVAGVPLDEACRMYHPDITVRENAPGCPSSMRCVFEDGSVITISEDRCWDLGYPDCFCWQTAGHSKECRGVLS